MGAIQWSIRSYNSLFSRRWFVDDLIISCCSCQQSIFANVTNGRGLSGSRAVGSVNSERLKTPMCEASVGDGMDTGR